MNSYHRLPVICIFLLTIFATGCSRIADHNRFLKERGIIETEKVPADYSGNNGWKPLAGDYVYFLDVFKTQTGPQMIYIVANKKENRLIGAMNVNPQIMTATYAPGVSPLTVVTNYEEMTANDIAKANDMTELNALLKAMPEMKNFRWKNTMQNQVASGIILKTHFIYITVSAVENSFFTYSEQPVMQDHDRRLGDILVAPHTMYHRDVKRLNRSVEMSQFVDALGFHYETKGNGGVIHSTEKFYIDDLLANDPINFEGKGKMFFFIPMKCYARPRKEGETPDYYPAIETYEYSTTPDADGFPVFKRNTHFASLLRVQNPETTP
jgi:hypothetical protein